MSLSLSTITNDLENLIAARDEVLAGEMCGACMGTATQFNPCRDCGDTGISVDTAALEQIEFAIKQYSTELLPAKVDAYWFTLKKIGKKEDSKTLDKQTGLIADAKREVKRLQALIDGWDALQETLRGYALEAMRQGNKKVLEGTNGRKLKRQNNGGALGVDVAQPDLVPEGLQRITVTMPLEDWREIENDMPMMLEIEAEVIKIGKLEPDLTAIRKELEKRVPCPNCEGTKRARVHEGDLFPSVDCPQCGGEGTVSGGVPGCRLKERGERLVVG